MRALIILFLTIINCCTYGETICFLLTEKGNNKCYNDSFVIQLSKPEDIAYARRIIMDTNTSALSCTVAAKIILGADGVNRNYLASGAPEWSWHAVFYSFADCPLPEDIFSPSEIEWNPVWAQKIYSLGIICFGDYRITSELGPLLEVTITQTSTNLFLNWADLNKITFQKQSDWGYYYTIENRNNMSESWRYVPQAKLTRRVTLNS